MRKLLLSLFLMAASLFFLPNLLSTSWGKHRFEHYLKMHLSGEVHIDSLSLSWFGKQTCKGVHWTQNNNQLQCFASEITCHAPLFDCLNYKSQSLDLSLEGGSISSAQGIKILRKKKKLDIHFTPVKVQVIQGSIIFERVELSLNEKHTFLMEGTVDLAKNYLDVQLGIPSETLKKMFKLKELPKGYVLEVPLSCSLTSQALQKKFLGIFLRNYAKVTSLQR